MVIDANNERLEDCKAFWDAGLKAGYDVLVAETPERSAVLCAKRSQHGRSESDIASVLDRWEPLTDLYVRIDTQKILDWDPSKPYSTTTRSEDQQTAVNPAPVVPARSTGPLASSSIMDQLLHSKQQLQQSNAKSQDTAAKSDEPPRPKRSRWEVRFLLFASYPRSLSSLLCV